MEGRLADEKDKLVEVKVKMPADLHAHLASICERSDLKLDDVVSDQIKRWLLGRTIALLEGSEEDEAGSAGAEPPRD
jgi:hypothetical protein